MRFIGQHCSNFDATPMVIVEAKPISSVQEERNHFSLYTFRWRLAGVHNLYREGKRLAYSEVIWTLAVGDGQPSPLFKMGIFSRQVYAIFRSISRSFRGLLLLIIDDQESKGDQDSSKLNHRFPPWSFIWTIFGFGIA